LVGSKKKCPVQDKKFTTNCVIYWGYNEMKNGHLYNSFIYEPPKFEEIEDGQWILPNTNVTIQDCKHYAGCYAINKDYTDHVVEVATAKTLAQAKRMALEVL
jgi:hypothetical protein